MSVKHFLDTNIFVYSFEPGEPQKRERAQSLIAEALLSGSGLISTQVIQEFLNVATRKFATPLSVQDSTRYLHKVLYPLCQVYPDLGLYESALELQQATGYSFYDALILAGAQHGGCQVLYSEDFQAGQRVGSVQIVDPFR